MPARPSDAASTSSPAATAALFLSTVAAQASVLVLSPLLPQVAAAFGRSVGDVGRLRSVSAAAALVTALAVGRRGAGAPLRRLISGGVALLVLGTLAAASAPSLFLMAIAQVPVGVGLGAVLTGAVAAADRWAAPDERTRVVAWTLVGQAAAWVAGMPLVGAVAARAGWRPALAAVPVVAGLAALVALRGAPAGRGSPASGGVAWTLHREAGRWALGEAIAFSAWSGTLVYAGALFASSYGLGPAAVGLVLGAGAAAYFPGSFAVRGWADRSAAAATASLAFAAAAVVSTLFAVRAGLAFSAAAFAVTAAVGGARTLAATVRGLELAGPRPLTSTGIRTAAQQLGYLLGAVVGGAALDRVGPAGAGFVFAALFVAAGIVTAWPVAATDPAGDEAPRPVASASTGG
jgi:predicted MFS family arabinose efflux permease